MINWDTKFSDLTPAEANEVADTFRRIGGGVLTPGVAALLRAAGATNVPSLEDFMIPTDPGD